MLSTIFSSMFMFAMSCTLKSSFFQILPRNEWPNETVASSFKQISEALIKMKVHPNQTRLPVAARITKFLISIQVIFVTKAKTGKLSFKFLSSKCFMGSLLWLVCPIVFYHSFNNFVCQPNEINNDNQKEKAIIFMINSLTLLSVVFRPFLTSYLVSECNGTILFQNMKMPNRWYLVLSTLLSYSFMSSFFSEIPDVSNSTKLVTLATALVYMSFSCILTFLTSMLTMNIYTSSFEAMCQKCKRLDVDSTTLNHKARKLIDAYQCLKTGMGPLILMFNTLGVATIISCIYRATRVSLASVLGNLGQAGFLTLCIFNICLICEDSFQSLQGLKTMLRYV